tara:strand:- start:1190 stop:1741 length:552 start_codon:yes stop_codon:yes gene_type:complete
MKEVSLGSDGTISLDNLKNCINSDLANNFGNLCQRVFTFVEKNCNNVVPQYNKFEKVDKDLMELITKKIESLKQMMDLQEINSYIKTVLNITFETNKYINDMEPWSLKKKDRKRMETVIYVALNQIRCISILLNPIIPISTNKVLNFLNYPNDLRYLSTLKDHKFFKPKVNLKKIEILFKKFD